MNLTFDKAIEILEIADISVITINDISTIRRNAQKRWHPDKVQKLNDENKTKEYESNFKFIDEACVIIEAFLKGTYHSGKAFEQQETHQRNKQWENTINNAKTVQEEFKNIWTEIKARNYKLSIKEIVISDGFNLKDLLTNDFKEDIAMTSIVALFYGVFLGLILASIGYILSPILGNILTIPIVAHILFCLLGALPLSRFWLPNKISDLMMKFVNFGFSFYQWVELKSSESDKWYLRLLVFTPVMFAGLFKYIILFPIYEIAKLIIKDKIVGVVKQKVKYYAEGAEWYIDDLLKKQIETMSNDEFEHLFYLYDDLRTVKN
jgi:hypothetical protein